MTKETIDISDPSKRAPQPSAIPSVSPSASPSPTSFVPLEPGFEKRVFEIGEEIFRQSENHQMSLFEKGFWSGKMMGWSMQYPDFKVELFRFVDVLPTLHSSEQVADHIRQYFLRPGLEMPAVVKAAFSVAASGLGSKIAASTIKANVASMASTFITGQDSQSAQKTLEKLWNSKECFTVDILGEAALSEKEALHYQSKYMELIQGLSQLVRDWKSQDALEVAPWGRVPRANVSVKCSSLFSQADNLDFRGSIEAIKDRLRPLLREAKKQGVFVNLDMEQNDLREMTLTLAEELFLEEDFRDYPHLGLVVQAYLKSSLSDLQRVKAFVERRSAPLTVRLVKGAYWDFEVIQCLQKDWPIPVFTDKAETDANYEVCADFLLSSYPTLHAAFGSHNVRNLAFCMARAESLALPKNAFEVQMLFGMAEPFKRACVAMGYRVRDYAPVGELLPGMAYLVRRLLENTSNEGFLRAKFVSHVESSELLKNPLLKIKEKKSMNTPSTSGFRNEPFRDFSKESERKSLQEATAKVRSQLPKKVVPTVNGRHVESQQVIPVFNPSRLTQKVTDLSLASRDDAILALQIAKEKMPLWAGQSVEFRAGVLKKAASLMRQRKDELAAWMVVEVAKNFREADADVAEAIDFCEYYAAEMLRLANPKPMSDTPGESNHYLYQARGVTVAISPWNFPLAILCGMTVAPLVAGNAVVMKPAEQSSAIARVLFDILIESGVPEGVLHFLPGLGEEVGAALVSSPDVHVINFTGSRAVGLQIVNEAAKVQPGQRHFKKVIAELGGKNAVIIDDDADLDEAVVGCLHAAFGFQGQKCSALSRILIVDSAFEKFKQRFLDAISSFQMGPADDVSYRVGPVIDADAKSRLLSVAKRHASSLVYELKMNPELESMGHYVAPRVFETSDFKSELGQVEFFGPFVTLFRVKSFDQALEVMNDTDYALTGGIYSRSPEHIDRARREIQVGNLYINRPITGALVCKQPFGGFRMSGCGGKAGGPDYLLNFLEPRSVTENTMRRGFAPELK